MTTKEETSLDFEALLSRYTQNFQKGESIKGTICSYEPNGVNVDIGAKAVAFCPAREISDEKNVKETLLKGEEYEFLIVDFDDKEERFTLSQKRVNLAYAWQELEKLKEANETILGEIVSVVKGGLIVEILGIRGFVPSSQILLRGKEYNSGDKIELKILTLDSTKDSFILSNKKVHSDIDEEAKKNIFAQVEKGQVLKGCVVRITDFGAFVDIGGIDGLLPLSQMSWRWVEHPSDILKLGEKIDVEVIAVDKEKGRISLSLKSLCEDPWLSAKSTVKDDDVVEGVVTRLKTFGAFVEILNGVEALVPIKEVEDFQRVNNCKVEVGDKVKSKILKFNFEDRRISLSILNKVK